MELAVPLQVPTPHASIYFAITIFLSFVSLAQMFLFCSERKSRTIARSEYILLNESLLVSSHINQTSSKKDTSDIAKRLNLKHYTTSMAFVRVLVNLVVI